jgi:hypothetical protein
MHAIVDAYNKTSESSPAIRQADPSFLPACIVRLPRLRLITDSYYYPIDRIWKSPIDGTVADPDHTRMASRLELYV